jgi:hypothetical protein
MVLYVAVEAQNVDTHRKKVEDMQTALVIC